jgi:two-component sensor histidine kinase/PAS domain-containing protein
VRQIITKGLASIYTDVPTLRPGSVEAYALAFASAGVATVVRLAIDPYVMGAECLPFFPAVIITALIGGRGAGLFCVVLSTAAVAFLQMPPLTLLLFALLAIFLVILITRMRLAIQREQAAQHLQDSKDRLQFALDAALLGWWQYDPIRGVVWWDTRLKEMFEIAEDWTDVEEFRRRVHPDDIERVWTAVEAAIEPTNPKQYATEFRHRRGDGEFRWIEAHAQVHFEGGGRERHAVSMVGTAQDVTERKGREEERKQLEEKEHLLMREVNHRAKNMLSVVDAIARQTATKNPEDFVERFSERIQALSANQDLLIRNEWQGVEIEDLVHAQLAPFTSLTGRIGVDGPKLRLKAIAAQAIGLALHELATNAGKYGSLSTDVGRLHIGWGATRDTFTMRWTEREGPPVSAPKRRGFGTTFIETMAERSLDGKVDLDYAPSGLTWRLTCPAANALEPPRA